MKSIITLASTLAILAAGTGHLPEVVHNLRMAQLQILKAMQSKNWGTPWTASEIERTAK